MSAQLIKLNNILIKFLDKLIYSNWLIKLINTLINYIYYAKRFQIVYSIASLNLHKKFLTESSIK